MQTVKPRFSTEVRRAEIVKTVLRLAAERTPGEITTADIAEAMGLTQGAVFRHFPTKVAIWLAVADWTAETLLESLERAAGSSHEPLEGVAAVFRAHVDFVMANPGVPRLIFDQLQQPGDSPVKRRVRAMLQSYRSIVIRLIQQAKTGGKVAAQLDEACATALFIGAVQGLVMQSMLAGSARDMKHLSEGVLALCLGGLARAGS